MVKLLKKTVLPLIFACVMLLSVGCDKGKEGGNNNSGGGTENPPVEYAIDSAEASNILTSLSDEIDGFVAKMNDKDVLGNAGVTPNMIPTIITLLNDSYRASALPSNFEEGEFEVDKLYANKTASTDNFVNVETENDEKLSVDFVKYSSVTIDSKVYEVFENYLYEITVDEGEIKSLKVRNFISNDKTPSVSTASVISMYEVVYDFENEVLDIFYAKPSKGYYSWMLNDAFLDFYFKAETLNEIDWETGILFTLKVNLKAQSENMVVAERYIGEFTDTLKTEILDFSYATFDANLTTLATSEEFEEIEDLFAEIIELSYVEYDDANNKFALIG